MSVLVVLITPFDNPIVELAVTPPSALEDSEPSGRKFDQQQQVEPAEVVRPSLSDPVSEHC